MENGNRFVYGLTVNNRLRIYTYAHVRVCVLAYAL